jgi:hypothetical protein
VRRLVGNLDHPDLGAELQEPDPLKRLGEQVCKLVLGIDVACLDVTSPRLNRINSILIPPSCNFFSGSPSAKNSRVKRAWAGAISVWVTDREAFPGAQSEDKSAQKRLGLVCRARL